MEAKCGNCKYFKARVNAEGECRYNPPVLLTDAWNGQRTVFPEVSIIDWCGKFKQVTN